MRRWKSRDLSEVIQLVVAKPGTQDLESGFRICALNHYAILPMIEDFLPGISTVN